jgi:hypothetical protein
VSDISKVMAALDVLEGPEWLDRINIASLDMGHPYNCVLGQLGYTSGARYYSTRLDLIAEQSGLTPKEVMTIMAIDTKKWKEELLKRKEGR